MCKYYSHATCDTLPFTFGDFTFVFDIRSTISTHGKRITISFFFDKPAAVAYPGIFFRGGGGSINSVKDRDNGDLGVVAP